MVAPLLRRDFVQSLNGEVLAAEFIPMGLENAVPIIAHLNLEVMQVGNAGKSERAANQYFAIDDAAYLVNTPWTMIQFILACQFCLIVPHSYSEVAMEPVTEAVEYSI